MSYTHVYYAKYSISLIQSDNNDDSVWWYWWRKPLFIFSAFRGTGRKKESAPKKTDDSYHKTMAGNQKET